MSNFLRNKWVEFLDGEWTKDSPTVRGTYRLATLQGEPVSETMIVYELDGKLGFAMHGAQAESFSALWGGYVWSIPEPTLPPVNE